MRWPSSPEPQSSGRSGGDFVVAVENLSHSPRIKSPQESICLCAKVIGPSLILLLCSDEITLLDSFLLLTILFFGLDVNLHSFPS